MGHSLWFVLIISSFYLIFCGSLLLFKWWMVKKSPRWTREKFCRRLLFCFQRSGDGSRLNSNAGERRSPDRVRLRATAPLPPTDRRSHSISHQFITIYTYITHICIWKKQQAILWNFSKFFINQYLKCFPLYENMVYPFKLYFILKKRCYMSPFRKLFALLWFFYPIFLPTSICLTFLIYKISILERQFTLSAFQSYRNCFQP